MNKKYSNLDLEFAFQSEIWTEDVRKLWDCLSEASTTSTTALYLDSTKFLDCQSPSSLHPSSSSLVLIGGIHTKESSNFSPEISAKYDWLFLVDVHQHWYPSRKRAGAPRVRCLVTHVLIWRGRDGVSWQSGEREVEGSLYWLVFRARAAIWLVRLDCRGLTGPPGKGFGEEQEGPGGGGATLRLEVGTRAGWEGGHRGEPGGSLPATEQTVNISRRGG